MPDERIVVTASLRDRLSEPLRNVEQQAHRTRAALESMCGKEGCLDDHSKASQNLARRTQALGASVDRTTRVMGVADRQTTRSSRGTRMWARITGAGGRVAARAAKGLSVLNAALTRGAGASGKASQGLNKVLKSLTSLRGGMGGLMGIVKILAMIALVGPATSALGALGSVAIAAVQAAAPLVGVFAALPAGILALVSSVGVLKSAFGGIGAAVKVLNDPAATLDQINAAMEGLTPEAQRFARVLHGYQPLLKSIKATAQAGLFPGVESMFAGMATLAPVIERGVRGIAEALGATARGMGDLFRTPEFAADLGAIMDGNSRLVGHMGDALLHVVSALRHVMVAAGPFVDWVGTMIRAFGGWLETTAAVNRANGDTARFLERTVTRLTQFGHILRDFGVGFANVFRAATGLADDGMTSLAGLAARFREWTGSAEGQQKITAYFDAMRPVIVGLGRLLTALGGGFLRLSQDAAPGTVSLLDNLLKIGPALRTMFTAASNSGLLDAIVSIAGSIATLLTVLPIGPITMFITALADLLALITRTIAENDRLGAILRGVLTVFIFGKGAIALLTGAFSLFASIAGGVGRVLGIVRAAWTLLGIAFAANPIGLVITAVVLLVAGLVLLYTTSERAREIMNTIGRVMWEVFGYTPLGAVIQNFDRIVDLAKRVVDAIRNINWPDPPDWMKGGGWSFLPGVGDTNRPRAGGGGLGNSAAQHATIDRSVAGRRVVTSGVRDYALGYGKSAHRDGSAFDLQGSGLNTYAKQVRALGGYAAFHGSGSGRHLHAEYGRGDSTRPRVARPQFRDRPQLRRPTAVGDTLRPRARAAAGGGSTQITVEAGAVQVINPAAEIDVQRAVAQGIADYERERRERA